jgi:hypothetical protein
MVGVTRDSEGAATKDEEGEGEEEEEGDEAELGDGSPGPSRRTRSNDKPASDLSMGSASSTNSYRGSRGSQSSRARRLPSRNAKKVALEALKGGEDDDTDGMDVDEEVTEAESGAEVEEEGGSSILLGSRS